MVNPGLEGVVAAQTAVCFIDGLQGRMLYRGHDIHDLAAHSNFEETAYLLWQGDLPGPDQLAELSEQLIAGRTLPAAVLDLLRSFPRRTAPMDVLRSAVSFLSAYDPDAANHTREANLRKAVRLTAQFASVTAAWHRISNGGDPIAPNPSLGHAANFLYMLNGTLPAPEHAKAFDVALILHADHELNASTFAARVTAATLSDMHSAVTSAVGTLKGPLHGGANKDVMDMLNEIGEISLAADYVREKLAAREKIPGFGHRVYKTEDPRATHLRRLSEELGRKAGDPKWYEMSRLIEQTMMELKGIACNVDFYSGSVYASMGIPTGLFTPVFACSRITGWTAHLLEQYADNRIIRPVGEYTGPTEARYIPMENRPA
ncbi:MAG: citrate synthase [Gemmatimonadetes bacterium]|nr:citrate synthase [Gemmatimonadota bacterium]MYK99372.1 citrate synthase [Gemmatimonadota bacterium]